MYTKAADRSSLSLGRLEGGSVALRLFAPTGPPHKRKRFCIWRRISKQKNNITTGCQGSFFFKENTLVCRSSISANRKEDDHLLRFLVSAALSVFIGVRMTMSVVSLLSSCLALLVISQTVTGQSQLIGSDDGTNQQSGNRCIDDEQNPQVTKKDLQII